MVISHNIHVGYTYIYWQAFFVCTQPACSDFNRGLIAVMVEELRRAQRAAAAWWSTPSRCESEDGDISGLNPALVVRNLRGAELATIVSPPVAGPMGDSWHAGRRALSSQRASMGPVTWSERVAVAQLGLLLPVVLGLALVHPPVLPMVAGTGVVAGFSVGALRLVPARALAAGQLLQRGGTCRNGGLLVVGSTVAASVGGFAFPRTFERNTLQVETVRLGGGGAMVLSGASAASGACVLGLLCCSSVGSFAAGAGAGVRARRASAAIVRWARARLGRHH